MTIANGLTVNGALGASSISAGNIGAANGTFGQLHAQVLTAEVKQFRIDNPLNPRFEYLQHTSVESPDMLNVYTGNATTDRMGYAVVRLPAYFEALNRDFRYQLTVIGSFARAVVWREISANRFTIRTDAPGVKVSWFVAGIRHDPWANAHRTQVIAPKTGADLGHYLNPDLYGQAAGAVSQP